jgi:prepilin-type N-terminal cleavage/methylation domain-containing protein
MKRAGKQAFTLIEMLVVIAVMATLAALIFPVIKGVNAAKVRSRTRAEMAQIITAIENYQAKLGHYPPDNVTNPATGGVNPFINLLYYELSGTTNQTVPGSGFTTYTTLDGRSQVRSTDLASAGFGAPGQVPGLANSSAAAGGDEGTTVVECFRGSLRPNQVVDLVPPKPPYSLKVLVGSVPVPASVQAANYPGVVGGYLTWRYNASKPIYNPNSYDLWIDVFINGKTNRICNWKHDYEIVSPGGPLPY